MSSLNFPELAQVLAKLREQTGTLAELSPILAELAELPESLHARVAPRAECRLNEFEAAIGHKSLNRSTAKIAR